MDFTFLLIEGIIVTGIIFFVLNRINDMHYQSFLDGVCPWCQGSGIENNIIVKFVAKYIDKIDDLTKIVCAGCNGGKTHNQYERYMEEIREKLSKKNK